MRWWFVALALVVGVVGLQADTLLLRNGTRVVGVLVSVRNGVVEFNDARGRRVRVSRDDVIRIELDRYGVPGDAIGGGGGRPPGLRERVVSVNARTAWTDTGISVRAGQTVYFAATGRVRWGPNRQDGPEGENNSPFNAVRPIPNRPAAALIGSVGNDKGIFFIGAERGPIRVRSSGRLRLGINDEGLRDNSGAFRVTVYY
jgi:hypothetical protein